MCALSLPNGSGLVGMLEVKVAVAVEELVSIVAKEIDQKFFLSIEKYCLPT